MRTVYFNRMGITEWRLRDLVEKTPAYFHVTLKNKLHKTVGVIVAQIDSTISLDSQEKLLCKIAEAMTPQYEFSYHVFTDSDHDNEKRCFAIILGEIDVNIKKIAQQVVICSSLSNLLRCSENKKKLWIEIKSLRDHFYE